MRQQYRKLMDSPHRISPAPVVEPSARKRHQKPGVLVVDDEHLVRIMVQLALERKGFNVWLATNGREAIDLYLAHREDIAVVLLDDCLPDLDGPETLDALRELDCEVPVCFMNGKTGDYNPEELRQRGAANVIAKPFLLADMVSILRLLTRGAAADRLLSGSV